VLPEKVGQSSPKFLGDAKSRLAGARGATKNNNDKNCSLSIVLTAMDQKLQKS